MYVGLPHEDGHGNSELATAALADDEDGSAVSAPKDGPRAGHCCTSQNATLAQTRCSAGCGGGVAASGIVGGARGKR